MYKKAPLSENANSTVGGAHSRKITQCKSTLVLITQWLKWCSCMVAYCASFQNEIYFVMHSEVHMCYGNQPTLMWYSTHSILDRMTGCSELDMSTVMKLAESDLTICGHAHHQTILPCIQHNVPFMQHILSNQNFKTCLAYTIHYY